MVMRTFVGRDAQVCIVDTALIVRQFGDGGPAARHRVRISCTHRAIDQLHYCKESRSARAVFKSVVSKPSLKRSYTD